MRLNPRSKSARLNCKRFSTTRVPRLTIKALLQVPAAALVQIFVGCGFVEYKMHGGKMGADNMFDGDRKPGDFGFDPLGIELCFASSYQFLAPQCCC